MKEVYLTLNIEKKDLVGLNLTEFTILNSYEVLDKYNYDLIKDSKETKLNYISTEIENSNSKILICNAGYNFEDFEKISLKIKSKNLKIDKILIPNQQKRNKVLAEGKELYENHNRWIDFYPGQVEDVYYDFEERIKNIKIGFKGTETEIIEL